MVVAAVAERAPSVTDAERAVAALAAVGVCEVWLHGSVARGEAGPDSDIDLVAVYPDLDYRQRWERKCELSELARASCRWEVDVFVTDLPEWTIRSRLVTSFERGVRTLGEQLLPPTGAVDGARWGKEIGLPGSDDQEALHTVKLANGALHNLDVSLTWLVTDRAMEDFRRELQVYQLCRESQMAAEGALKALVHLYGHRPPPDTHSLGALCADLPRDIAAGAGRFLEGINRAEMSRWRLVGTYPADYPEAAARGPELAEPYLCAAVGLNRYAVLHVEARTGPDPLLEQNRKLVADVAARIDEYETVSGRPRAGPSPLISIAGLAPPRPRLSPLPGLDRPRPD